MHRSIQNLIENVVFFLLTYLFYIIFGFEVVVIGILLLILSNMRK